MTRNCRNRNHAAAGVLVVLALVSFAGAETRAQPVDRSPSDGQGGFGDTDNELTDLSLEDLMEVQVVVTASRHEQKITTVPYAMSVVTAADIRAAGARSVPDALRLVPGVDVADLSFGNAAVSPRGFHGFLSNQVLVLVDGRQIYDSLFGGTLWGGWPFQMEDIARIEVIRGPGGVTWGANAINGVINIITKDPADQFGLTSVSVGGSRGGFKQYLGYGTQEGKLRLRVSGEYEASDGFKGGGSILRSLDDEYKGGRFNLHAVYDRDDNDTFMISAGSAVVDGGFPTSPLAGFGLRRNAGQQSNFVMMDWEHRIRENEHFNLTAFVNDFFASPGLPQIDYRYQQFGLQFSHTAKLSQTRQRIWGIDSRVDILDAGNSDPFMLSKGFVSTAILGLYLQEEWRFAPRWTLNLGGRIDYEFYGGFQPSARASLSYDLSDDALIYGAVSRAFHMPTAAGRFLNIPLVNGLSRATSNRGVDPTTLVAYEIGYRGKPAERLDTRLNLFWHQYDEVATLSPTLGPPGLLQYNLDNRAGQASLYGAEVEATYRATEKLTLLGNYTYQQLNWDVDEPFTDRDFITPPKHKFMLGARYSVNDDLRLSSHLYYVDATNAPNPANPFQSRGIDPYFRLDLRAEYEFWDDRASVAVGVSNLLDSGHFEGSTLFLNDAEVPRMVFAELRFKIK
ncbi:MAG: TonB-dependent receptor plug domain-containing protein [Phycisphaerae bacterium]